MNKRILILGSDGMFGHTCSDYLKSLNRYDIYTVSRTWNWSTNHTALDIRDEEDLRNLEDNIKYAIEPNIIINAIGILVKTSENDPENAIWINSYFPHWLEKITKNTQTKIIHLSTDCVFSGKKGNYLNTDEPDGIGIYARSKALGEVINKKDLTIRTSFIGSPIKQPSNDLLSWFLRQDGTVLGYTGALWSGITTLELAKAIDKLINSNIVGLYHLAPEYNISKYDLLELIQYIWNKQDITLIPDETLKQDKTLINSEPPIPNYLMPIAYFSMIREYKDYLDGK